MSFHDCLDLGAVIGISISPYFGTRETMFQSLGTSTNDSPSRELHYPLSRSYSVLLESVVDVGRFYVEFYRIDACSQRSMLLRGAHVFSPSNTCFVCVLCRFVLCFFGS